MRSPVYRLIKLMLVVFALSLSGCASVTVTPETMASMSDEAICRMLGRWWLSSKEEQSLIRAELDRREVVCDEGKIVGYRRQQQQTPTATKTPRDPKIERLRFYCEPEEGSIISEYETETVEGYKGGWLFIDVNDGVKSASLTLENPAGERTSFHGMYDEQLAEEKRKEYDALGYDVSVMVFSNRHIPIPEAKILIMVHRQPDDAVHVSALRKEKYADLLLQLPCTESELRE